MNSGIYIIKNNINSKVYVGQTNNFRLRWNTHKSKYKKNKGLYPALHSAFSKYGFDNFTFEIIARCPVEYLDKMEIFFIKHYNSYNTGGYNCTIGGQGFTKKNKVHMVSTSGEVLKSYENVTKSEIDSSSIYKVLSGKRSQAGGYIWVRNEKDIPNQVAYYNYCKERIKNNWNRKSQLTRDEFINNNLKENSYVELHI